MSAVRLEEVSSACRRRLVNHYGSAVEPWLAMVPAMLGEVAERWRLSLDGYYDAGCASVLARACDSDGHAVLIKAWFDRSRYASLSASSSRIDGPTTIEPGKAMAVMRLARLTTEP